MIVQNGTAFSYLRNRIDSVKTLVVEGWNDILIKKAPLSDILFSSPLNQTVPAATTQYAGIGGGAGAPNVSEIIRRSVMPRDGTIKNLFVATSTTQPANGALTITVRKNNAATGVQIVIPGGSAAGVYSDITHSVDVLAGDIINMDIVNASADTVSAALAGLSALFAY